MREERLTFQVRSGGTVSIDRSRCPECPTKACVDVCAEQGGPLVLDDGRRIPALRPDAGRNGNGGCVECLGCELVCDTRGLQAVSIELPVDGFDRYLATLTDPVVYPRER